jgi:hypothetical protein
MFYSLYKITMGDGTAWGGRRTCNAEISDRFESDILHHTMGIMLRVSLMVKYWAHNPGTDNASPSSTLGPAT